MPRPRGLQLLVYTSLGAGPVGAPRPVWHTAAGFLIGVLVALLPFGRSRNYGLLATFLTPLVVVLIDLLNPGGWRLAEDRLIDTLIGCAIVLLIGFGHCSGYSAPASRSPCRRRAGPAVVGRPGKRVQFVLFGQHGLHSNAD